jgi:hypothetical protein
MRRASVLLACAACAGGGHTTAFAPPSDLVAERRDHDVELRWRHRARAPGGYWVESTTPGGDFVKLGAVWPDAPRFRHTDLAPETTFLYRVQPFFGEPSVPAELTTGEGPAGVLEAGPFAPPGEARAGRSLRAHADASPAALSVTLAAADTVELRWQDGARDEDGYLVEIADGATASYAVRALLPADSVSFRAVALPQRTRLRFRVRAFFYGTPSEVVAVTTPAE